MSKETKYNFKTEQLQKIAWGLVAVICITWLLLSAGIVQVLHMYDKWIAFLVILVIGIVVNAVQVGIMFLYVLGYIMFTNNKTDEEEDEQSSDL